MIDKIVPELFTNDFQNIFTLIVTHVQANVKVINRSYALFTKSAMRICRMRCDARMSTDTNSGTFDCSAPLLPVLHKGL